MFNEVKGQAWTKRCQTSEWSDEHHRHGMSAARIRPSLPALHIGTVKKRGHIIHIAHIAHMLFTGFIIGPADKAYIIFSEGQFIKGLKFCIVLGWIPLCASLVSKPLDSGYTFCLCTYSLSFCIGCCCSRIMLPGFVRRKLVANRVLFVSLMNGWGLLDGQASGPILRWTNVMCLIHTEDYKDGHWMTVFGIAEFWMVALLIN